MAGRASGGSQSLSTPQGTILASKRRFLPLPGSLTACRAGAVHRRDPEVRGAGVKDDGEVLRWGADGDRAEVFHLQGRESVCVSGGGAERRRRYQSMKCHGLQSTEPRRGKTGDKEWQEESKDHQGGN